MGLPFMFILSFWNKSYLFTNGSCKRLKRWYNGINFVTKSYMIVKTIGQSALNGHQEKG
jgi:hypothetical protein